ncbi:murein L,D-transpeptidase catalytic domain family protein [Hymenobacter koreensis]|uniref:Murein L,D-transpeptidase catalytic domain family protein n=1 Tax=Hymenobacter koreensis TaxID=1084523 RepID=A0ABP8IWD6_9BACT
MEKHTVVHRLRLKVRARRAMRRALPFVASLFLATPLASPVSSSQARPHSVTARMPSVKQFEAVAFQDGVRQLYNELNVADSGLRYEVFQKAYTGFLNLKAKGQLDASRSMLTVIDFEKPSTEKRLWVLDLSGKQVLFHTLVAHGHNSGENVATNFSNENESNMSSLGFYVTKGDYYGKHGRSLKLEGVDEGYNDRALERSVVMHGAEYVSEEFIKQYGRLGRSLGCPSLPMDQYAQVIDTVQDGTCLFLNGPDQNYDSEFLNTDMAAHQFSAEANGSNV